MATRCWSTSSQSTVSGSRSMGLQVSGTKPRLSMVETVSPVARATSRFKSAWVMAVLRQQREIIWRTRISIELDRNNLPTAMGAMLVSAAPFIGSETDVPVFMGERDRRKSDVQIGELEVIESDPR